MFNLRRSFGMLSCYFYRDIASAIKTLLDAVTNVFAYVEGHENKQVCTHYTHVIVLENLPANKTNLQQTFQSIIIFQNNIFK